MLSLLLAAVQDQAPRTLEDVPLSLRVNHAIALGVEYLERVQGPDGTYRYHDGPHPGGTTALVAYTLVKSGVRRDAPALQRALAALEGNEYRSTYAASVHLLLCEALRDESRAREARKSLEYLLEGASVQLDHSGYVVAATGAASQGQGHQTVFAQIVADALGVPIEWVTVMGCDTGAVPLGVGTFASRGAVTAGSSLLVAAREVREKLVSAAATLLEKLQ